ncbi:MAG: RidA family protein [Bdellovibrionales bacterium]|nr:RidA family protein [Bdellovibrionales bacterium]
MRVLHPEGWPKPKGYSYGIENAGKLICVAGQIGWTPEGQIVSNSFLEQSRQALQNIIAVVEEAGGAPHHVARLTWYVVDKAEYLACSKELGSIYREVFGSHYPAMTLVQVGALLEPDAKVEIEATAVINGE